MRHRSARRQRQLSPSPPSSGHWERAHWERSRGGLAVRATAAGGHRCAGGSYVVFDEAHCVLQQSMAGFARSGSSATRTSAACVGSWSSRSGSRAASAAAPPPAGIASTSADEPALARVRRPVVASAATVAPPRSASSCARTEQPFKLFWSPPRFTHQSHHCSLSPGAATQQVQQHRRLPTRAGVFSAGWAAAPPGTRRTSHSGAPSAMERARQPRPPPQPHRQPHRPPLSPSTERSTKCAYAGRTSSPTR
ncbi:hypothetical protein T492DRAFT_1073641 [Pavlovales sp. CCMP2436]|nr:hypothetical protein T492DRAFT_1073641 [Pavlovales sp. CCMP2436]